MAAVVVVVMKIGLLGVAHGTTNPATRAQHVSTGRIEVSYGKDLLASHSVSYLCTRTQKLATPATKG